MKPDETPNPIDLARVAPFALGGAQVRPSTRELISGQRREVLEPRVMQVLVALSRQRGEVVSRDGLIAACWGGRVVSEDALNRAISQVRRLAEAVGGFSVDTVARVGYRLEAADATAATAPAPGSVGATPRLAVLPFDNLSADPELAYFSDGVSEEILDTLARARDLQVISRGSSFQYRGAGKAVPRVSAELNATHLLDGSVRRSGERVRIAARLVECSSDTTLWSERFDGDLSDVFALQDGISEAIVRALKATLAPEEKRAIARRGTENPAAYDLYLMARRHYVTGLQGDPQWAETIIRLSRRATELDPGYASAWALLALGQVAARYMDGEGESGLAAVERALALDPGLAEAYAVKARIFSDAGLHAQARDEVATALRLDPESWRVNYTAALVFYADRRLAEATRHFEKAAALEEVDFISPTYLITCHGLTGDHAAALHAAELALAHAEKVLAHDRNNGFAMAVAGDALAVLGHTQRAREWIERALLLSDNFVVRNQIAGTVAEIFREPEAAVDLLAPAVAKMSPNYLDLVRASPRFDSIRDHPRFKAMMAEAEGRPSSPA
jgi:adenylate cyclase